MIDPIDDRRLAARLVEQLATGREQAEDPALALLGDTPLEAARHVASHRRGLGTDVLLDELRPVRELTAYIRREADRVDRDMIRGLIRRGVTYSQIAELLDLNSRQAAEALHKRLEAACAGEAKDPTLARRRSREQPPPTPTGPAGPGRPGQPGGGERVVTAIGRLLQVEELLPDLEKVTGFDTDDLRRLARPDLAGTEGAAAQVRVVLRDLARVEGLNEQVRAAVLAGADLLELKIS